jgi:hypothetical protein
LQYGVAAFLLLQSASTTQIAQRPRFVSQMGEAVPQSLFDKHCTHWLRCVLHSGAWALHCELFVQPARHWKSCGSQIGWALPQSLFARHSTQL